MTTKEFIFLVVGIIVGALGSYFLGGLRNPITPEAVTQVMAPAPVAQVCPEPIVCPPVPAVLPPTLEECKAIIKAAQPVKKVVKKRKAKKVAPAAISAPAAAVVAPVVPRYVPVPYNKPTVKNPETGKMVPTMPLGVQPVMSCAQTTGGVPCAK